MDASNDKEGGWKEIIVGFIVIPHIFLIPILLSVFWGWLFRSIF